MRRLPALVAIFSLACHQAPAPSPANITHVPQASGTTALLIAVSAVSDSIAWASGSGGTWVRTVDGGNTWQAGKVPGADSLQFRDVHAVDANHAWLLSIGNGAASRVYYTADGGTNWTLQFTNPDSAAFYDCFGFWDAQRAVAVGDAVAGHTGILTTDDGGLHWNPTPSATTPTAPDGEEASPRAAPASSLVPMAMPGSSPPTASAPAFSSRPTTAAPGDPSPSPSPPAPGPVPSPSPFAT